MVGGAGGPGGVGKPGGVAPGALEPAGPSPAAETSFGAVRDAAKVTDVQGPSAIEKLKTGQIDVAGYVELKVEQATKHLVGLLPPAEIERVQTELRDLIADDPDVAALVKAAEIGR